MGYASGAPYMRSSSGFAQELLATICCLIALFFCISSAASLFNAAMLARRCWMSVSAAWHRRSACAVCNNAGGAAG